MKKITLISAFLLSFVLILSSCGGTQPEETVSTETEEITEDELVIIEDGKTDYCIVRTDEAGDELVQASVELRNRIEEVTGVKPEIKTDFDNPKVGAEGRSPYEILVGSTNRDESAQALSRLGYMDYGIFVIGTRVCIIGGCEDATVKAIEYFEENMLTGTNIALNGGLTYISREIYEAADASVGGVAVTEFTIVYGQGYKSYADTLAARLGRITGAILSYVPESSDKAAHEIVLSSTKHDTKKTFDGEDDYEISVRDGSIYIQGGSKYAVGAAMTELCSLISEGKSSAAELSVTYTLPEREEYINDISKLAMRWSGEFEPEEWLLDFNEKYAAILDPDGRMMSCIHRGDSKYYPENSVEGYISCILMGADMIEIDPRLTKDGVFVLMHDASLERTTDFSEKAGKNGLPTSPALADWTYAELQQLNLKSGNGGTDSKVTSFKIPTLEEAIKVCAGRVFIRLDVKGPTSGVYYWNFVRDIWPLEQKYSSYDNILFTWHSVFSADSYALVKKYKALQTAACGRSSVSFVGCSASKTAREVLNTIKTNNLDPLVRLTDYDWDAVGIDSYIKNNGEKLAALKGNARAYVDAQATSKGTGMKETPEYWNKLQEAGISILLVNESVSFVKYIQENYTPAAY